MVTTRELMRTEVVTVPEDMSVREVAALLADEGITGVPVVDSKGEVQGVVSAKDILGAAAESGPVPLEGVEGLDQLDDDWFDSTSYVDAESPVRDIPWERVWPASSGLEERRVSEIMNRNRFSVDPDTSVSELAKYLTQRAIHRALVLERGHLVGIVTSYDIMRAVADGRLVAKAGQIG